MLLGTFAYSGARITIWSQYWVADWTITRGENNGRIGELLISLCVVVVLNFIFSNEFHRRIRKNDSKQYSFIHFYNNWKFTTGKNNETTMKVYYVRCVELIKANAHRTHVVIFIWFENMSFKCLIVPTWNGKKKKWNKKCTHSIKQDFLFIQYSLLASLERFISIFSMVTCHSMRQNEPYERSESTKIVVCELEPPHIRFDRHHRWTRKNEKYLLTLLGLAVAMPNKHRKKTHTHNTTTL